jgi:hypothetical protein
MELRNLIEPKTDLPKLAKYLDEVGHPGRLWAVNAWDRKLQAKLYEAAKGFRPVTLDDYVPPGTDPLVEVIHHGKNTLPLHTHFQKRFCKPSDETQKDVLYGFNYQTLSGLTGPGYFVTHPATDEGEVDIDYTMIPKEKPDLWPKVIPNSKRLGRFVYDGMIDVMRGISTHVSIGRAKKKSGWMDAWFVLVREDPTPAEA